MHHLALTTRFLERRPSRFSRVPGKAQEAEALFQNRPGSVCEMMFATTLFLPTRAQRMFTDGTILTKINQVPYLVRSYLSIMLSLPRTFLISTTLPC